MSTLRISIVTPTLNRAHYLGDAIESVRAQGYPDFEHIVVDGGSTDGTSELLRKYPHLRVISEPDHGLYEALGKGIRLATGEVLGHLNSDDFYAPGTFPRVAAAFADPAVEAVCGGVEVFTGDDPVARRVLERYLTPRELALSFENLTLGSPLTNARFFRRNIYERAGLPDQRFSIAADRDFLLRVALLRPREALLDGVVYRYRVHPGALTFNEQSYAASADVADARSARTWREFLEIAEKFLARPDLPADLRPWLQRWHELWSVKQTITALRAGEWTAAARCAQRGLRHGPRWPWRFLRTAATGVRERLGAALGRREPGRT